METHLVTSFVKPLAAKKPDSAFFCIKHSTVRDLTDHTTAGVGKSEVPEVKPCFLGN